MEKFLNLSGTYLTTVQLVS